MEPGELGELTQQSSVQGVSSLAQGPRALAVYGHTHHLRPGLRVAAPDLPGSPSSQ